MCVCACLIPIRKPNKLNPQKVVPKITFAKMLELALEPPEESMVLPYSEYLCVSILLQYVRVRECTCKHSMCVCVHV